MSEPKLVKNLDIVLYDVLDPYIQFTSGTMSEGAAYWYLRMKRTRPMRSYVEHPSGFCVYTDLITVFNTGTQRILGIKYGKEALRVVIGPSPQDRMKHSMRVSCTNESIVGMIAMSEDILFGQ